MMSTHPSPRNPLITVNPRFAERIHDSTKSVVIRVSSKSCLARFGDRWTIDRLIEELYRQKRSIENWKCSFHKHVQIDFYQTGKNNTTCNSFIAIHEQHRAQTCSLVIGGEERESFAFVNSGSLSKVFALAVSICTCRLLSSISGSCEMHSACKCIVSGTSQSGLIRSYRKWRAAKLQEIDIEQVLTLLPPTPSPSPPPSRITAPFNSVVLFTFIRVITAVYIFEMSYIWNDRRRRQ